MDARLLRQGGCAVPRATYPGPAGEKFISIGSFCFWLLAFGGAILFLLVTSLAAHSKNKRLEEELRELENEIRTLEEQNAQLQKEKEALKSDRIYVERILRDEFKMTAPDEFVLVEESQ